MEKHLLAPLLFVLVAVSISTQTGDVTPPATALSEAAPAQGDYALVSTMTTATFPQMLGLAPIPGAPDEAVVITQNGLLWRVSFSDAFAPVAFGDMLHCPDGVDNDGDTRVNDGCPASAAAESGSGCTDATDNDTDGFINDGCGAFDPIESCLDVVDNESDGYVNDGCPASGPSEAEASQISSPPHECADAIDNDSDGLINDGCPVITPTEAKLLLGSEEGLAGLAFSPDYQTDGRIYLYYTAPENSPPDPTNYCCRDRLARFQVTNNSLDLASEVLLLDQHDREPWHVGGQLAFGPDGYFYVSLGDEGWQFDPYANAQNKAVLWGKVLRIDVTGEATYSIPPGNPFADGPGGNADEIYAYGFRNPWRFSFDTAPGDLWLGDVGQFNWEEVNKVVSGDNYGWDVMEGDGCVTAGCTPPPGSIAPRASYCHSQWLPSCPGYPASGDCAIIGGFVYHGEAMPELDGWYVYGDFCTGRIWALDAASSSSPLVLLTDSPYMLSSFAVDPDGELLVLTYNNAIFHLAPDDQDDDDDGVYDASEGDCGGPIDDDANGLINDGCPAQGPAEFNQCTNSVNDDVDSRTNDGCPAVGGAEVNQCAGSADEDADARVNDGCPAVSATESDGSPNGGANCSDNVDSDADTVVNDGCPALATPEIDQCALAADDDSDGRVNDGCAASGSAEIDQCANSRDDDNEGWANDGCPGTGESYRCGANARNPTSRPERLDTAGDDDLDGAPNEALPAGSEVYDCDGDGFEGTAEPAITTTDQDPCGNNGWPLELVSTPASTANRYNISDLGSFIAPIRRLGTSENDTGFSARWDLEPGDSGLPTSGWINVVDLGKTNAGTTAFPPMLGGRKALNQLCPYPP
jgi:glucose/arabinose dehydrogenase